MNAEKQIQSQTGLPPTPVAVIGMEKRTFSLIEKFFQTNYENNYVLVKEDMAEISIIDMDGYSAEAVLEQHKADFPDRTIILTSIHEIKSIEEFYIQKPIKISLLSAVLTAAEKQAHSISADSVEPPVLNTQISLDSSLQITSKAKTRTTRSDNRKKWSSRSLDSLASTSSSGLHLLPDDINNDEITRRLLRELQYDPEKMLQGYFKKAYDTALASRCNVKLAGPWRPIIILIKKHRVLVDSNFRHIFALSAMTFEPEQIKITLLRKDEDDESYTGAITQTIEQFFWKLSLRTSRGKVPIGTDLNVPILLKQWPNFTRTTETPHALRIAALWSKQPTSLLRTAEILNISLSFVFVFYSSALPLNLLSHLKDGGQAQNSAEKMQRHTYRKLFGSLLHKITNRKSVDVN